MLKYFIVFIIVFVICIALPKGKKSTKYIVLTAGILVLALMLFNAIKYLMPIYSDSCSPTASIKEHNDRIDLPFPTADPSNTYLDDKRDLKEVYSISDIGNETSAFYAGYSTLLLSPMDGFSVYFRQDIRDNLWVDYSLSINKSANDDTLHHFALKEKTDFQTLDEYYKNLQKFSEEKRTEDGDEPNVLKKTDDYVFYSRKYNGYQYELTKEIGGKVYTIYADTEYLTGWNKKEAPGNEVTEAFREDALYIFDHLQADDGKTAYIYDKLVNVPLPEGYRIRSYTDISVYADGGFTLEVPEEKNVWINFGKNTDLPPGWVRQNDIYIDNSRGSYTDVYYEDGDITCAFHFGKKHDFQNLEECLSYLEGTGVLVKKT